MYLSLILATESKPKIKIDHSEESPPEKDNNEQGQSAKRPILLKQQFPINSNSSLPIFLTILPQPTADLTHALQTISPIQQILDILSHDFRNVSQLIVQFVEVLSGSRIGISGFGALNESVEFHEGVGSHVRTVDLL